MIGCFISGTDTGVGKTLVATSLLHALARHHRRVVGMKPVATGAVRVGNVWRSEDAIALRAASTIEVPPELDNPVLLPDPLSPHIAARRAGARIDIDHLVACDRELSRRADAVVVEGAGGFHVPLSETRRAEDGLWRLSSRNGYLSPAECGEAVQLSLTLKQMAAALKAGQGNHAAIEAEAMESLTQRGWKPDYMVVRRRADLLVPTGDEPLVVLGAARLGNTRLIDNLEV
jgi:dethiobiotin synthetase